MKPKYTRLTLCEREQFALLRTKGKSFREIARIMGRSHSTLVREFNNRAVSPFLNIYFPFAADLKASIKKNRVRVTRSLKTAEIRAYVDEKIALGWSPEQVSGRLKLDKPGLITSHEAIYLYIYTKARHLIPNLARQHKWRQRKYRKRARLNARIPNRVPVSMRPVEIEKRLEFGHWESDSMISRANKVALHVLVERKSRFAKISKILQNDSLQVKNDIIRQLQPLPVELRRSITYDNGPENRYHEHINENLGSRSYFCSPYHFWEKGLVEQTNGLIRRFLPKKTDLAEVTETYLEEIEALLNTRPRKCLNFKTPEEVLQPLSGALQT